jgi:predicted metalloprotease with PDZ domain
VGDPATKRLHTVEIFDLPKGWQAYSSLGPDPARMVVKSSYDDMVETSIGAGRGEAERFTVRSKPVSVFVGGEFDIPRAEIFTAVKRIVTLEREWFADFDHPFYTVTILPRSGIIAGTCIPNLFVCFARSDVSRDELNVLIAHEMFHTWLPNKASIAQAKGESALRYEWFYEGFTDYFARTILAEAGLLGPARFAELVNQDIDNLAVNPARNGTFADLLAAQKARKYDTAYKKLAYYRGALIALKWDATIRGAGKGRTLADFIREFCRLAGRRGGKLTEDAFFGLAAEYGIDAKGDLERHIIRGEPISVSAGALGDRFELRDAEVSAFQPGFSIVESFKSSRVAGVVENGPAARAGLRNGMELVGMNNSNRFGNGWRADRPLTVTVRIDGRPCSFEFFPHGPRIPVKRFVAREGK